MSVPETVSRHLDIAEEVGDDSYPIPIPTRHKLIVGDSRRVNYRILGKVHLVVTSPPYGNLKDYGAKQQIGFLQDGKGYFRSLMTVWKKCIQTLEPGGRLIVNVGDQYLSTSAKKPYHIIPIHAMVVNDIMTGENKVDYLGSIIWNKISTTKTSGGGSVMGSYPYPRKAYPCYENEYIAIFRKPGETDRPPAPYRALARMKKQEWRRYTSGMWRFPGAKMDENPAAFPEELPRRLIKMFSFPGETVLDPFVGSGTTMKVAASLARNSIGIELGFNTRSGRPFAEIIRERVLSAELEPYAGPPSFSTP